MKTHQTRMAKSVAAAFTASLLLVGCGGGGTETNGGGDTQQPEVGTMPATSEPERTEHAGDTNKGGDITCGEFVALSPDAQFPITKKFLEELGRSETESKIKMFVVDISLACMNQPSNAPIKDIGLK